MCYLSLESPKWTNFEVDTESRVDVGVDSQDYVVGRPHGTMGRSEVGGSENGSEMKSISPN